MLASSPALGNVGDDAQAPFLEINIGVWPCDWVTLTWRICGNFDSVTPYTTRAAQSILLFVREICTPCNRSAPYPKIGILASGTIWLEPAAAKRVDLHPVPELRLWITLSKRFNRQGKPGYVFVHLGSLV